MKQKIQKNKEWLYLLKEKWEEQANLMEKLKFNSII